MSDFNDDFDADEVADAMEDARDAAREDAARDAWMERGERFGIGVCTSRACVEPCGPNGGCIR